MAAIAVFAALLFRNSGVYPMVPDECTYSRLSRLLPLADATLPDYLYLMIYRATNLCGDGFLNFARVLNAIFFVAAMPFIYLTARRVSTRRTALIVALLAVLGPMNIYTAYFMPEALYFFSFWLLTWFILRLDNTLDSRSWCFAGILLGLASLIKPHALFLLPAMVAYSLYVSRKREGEWVLQAVWNTVVFVAFVFAVKFSISYLIAGKGGLTIFGPFYTGVAGQTTSNFGHCLDILLLSAESAKGHILAICLMFGVPIAFAIKTSFDSLVSKEEMSSGHKIAVYALLVLANLIVVTTLFTASMRETERLHLRYYSFALPLLIVIAAYQLSLEQTGNMLKHRAIVAFPVGTAILYALYTVLAPYKLSIVDCPELFGFTLNAMVFYVLSGISFFALVLWVHSGPAGAKMFLYLLMPLAVGFSNYYANQDLRQRLVPQGFDKAAIFTKQFLSNVSNEALSKLVVVGSAPWASAIYLDNPEVSFETVPVGTAYDWSRLPAGKEWILVMGGQSLPENICYQLQMDDFTLARATCATTIDFKNFSWPGVISRTRGLSTAERWGTWSLGDVVTLEFYKPLPEKFTVHLVACAYGLNVEKVFVAHVGDSAVGFTLTGSPEERVLEFTNPKRSRVLKIVIPSPCSPKDLGLGDDDRRLGVAFTELRIEPQ